MEMSRIRLQPRGKSTGMNRPDGRYTLEPATVSESLQSPNDVSVNEAMDSSMNSTPSRHEQVVRSRSYGASSSAQAGSPPQLTIQPSVVGESWYASYVMRGYTPGHSSVHRPIGECNETVQDVTFATGANDVSRNLPQPQDKPGLSDLPRPDIVDSLIKAYFDRFHTFCPILSKRSFFTSIHEGTVSATLLRSILFVASLHCDLEVLHRMGHSTRLDANHTLFSNASASFDIDRDSTRLDMILSSYLLHYWFGNPTAYRDCHWWIAAAIRSAQCTGYHRSTSNSQMCSEQRSRWKRIWWCLYVRDRQIAISTGTPMVINDMDYDVEELVAEDLVDESVETAQYIVAQRQCNKSKETKLVVDAATQVFNLAENSLLYWTPERFPMIYVSALFSAMMALAVDGSTTAPRSDQMFAKIRRGLLALKQFEQVYNLARWIKNFFMDILNRSDSGKGSRGEDQPASPPDHGRATEMRAPEEPTRHSDSQDVPSHILAGAPSQIDQSTFVAPDLAIGDTTFMFGQDSGDDSVDGGGFWPTYLASGVFFSSTGSGDAIDFPQPDSTQYQAMYFLADLGIANGSSGPVYDGTRTGRSTSAIRLSSQQFRSNVSTSAASYKNGSVNRIGVYMVGLAVIGVGYAATTIDWSKRSSPSSTQPLTSTPRIQHDITAANIRAATEEFAALLGAENVSTDQADLITHSGSDYQSYAWTKEHAICSNVILYPETTEQVSELMKICSRRRLPVTPYSGGTSIEGQYIPHFRGICIDFGRMSSIVELNKDDLDCVVQPGIGWMDLNEELATHGLFFPPDPGPGAMIGEWLEQVVPVLMPRHWVLSLTVVLADGTIIKTRQRARKSSAGYDLTRTFIGSEGTLGLVTEATLKLAVKPPCEAVAVCTFPSLRDAASAVRDVLSAGIQVAAVEILDDVQMKSINESALTSIKWKEEPTLFFKFTGSDDFIVEHVAKKVGVITKQNRSTAYTFASDETERNELWSARKNALWSMLAMRKSPTDKVWTTDVAVPMSRLPDIIDFAKDDIEKSGLVGSIVGHVGDGNFHTLLLFPEDKRQVAEDIVHRMVGKAIEMKGTATGEHGVGLVKRDYLEKELGKDTVDMMRSMKNAFDPMCILNCDKVIRMQAA
ncbi:D-lactate dehydrogenase [cytochrome], mitochondrial [Fusarium culmorum]|uniref:D-lactate dehydrogenase (cytochrome) n=1 Tax=Fusarium culmorum TaxID=5516 RepID=A0A2T4GWL9_FUSCU|nr:D-lactate dehydrogenase [cytochrome], mitochondrial [Fusarium culmorum]